MIEGIERVNIEIGKDVVIEERKDEVDKGNERKEEIKEKVEKIEYRGSDFVGKEKM